MFEAVLEVDAITFGDRLRRVQQAVSSSISEFAEVLGVTRQTIYDWFKLTEPTNSAVGAVASSYSTISVKWLETGAGEMRRVSPDGSEDEEHTRSSAKMLIRVAPYGHGAGNGVVNDGSGEIMPVPEEAIRRMTGGRLPRQVVLSWVRGESMLPYLHPGEPIWIEEIDRFEDGGRYAVWIDDADEDVIKRVERIGGRLIRLSSDNNAYEVRLLEHVEDDVYRDAKYNISVQLRIRGRVIYPPDMARAVMGQVLDFASALLSRKGNGS